MTFYGYFNSINGSNYGVEISTGTGSEEIDIKLGGSPCILSTASTSLFTPIKSRSLTIEMFTKEWYMDLYEPTSRGTTVKLYDYISDYTVPNRVYFRGYLTPCSYDQTWTYADTIQLEAVDAISTTKDFKWINNGQYNSFFEIIINILKSAGYRGNLYVPTSYTKINGSNVEKTVITELFASSTNFLDDNEERTPWTEYEVLEEILKFLGWSLVPDGDDVWCVDYRMENSGSTTYYVYDIQTKTELQNTYTSPNTNTSITLSNIAPGTTKISIDDIYNKIEVNDNLYKIEEISPDIFDDNTHISVTDEADIGLDQSKWSSVRRKSFLWWEWDDKKEYLEGTDYQTLCRLKPNSGWTHYYYRMSDGTLIGNSQNPLYERSYYDSATATNPNQIAWKGSKTIQKVNTRCCLLQHYAFIDESHPNNVPSSVDWSDILTFFILGPSMTPVPVSNLSLLEAPVLEYNISETVQWKPSSGKSWITIKGSLFYQGRCSYKDGKKTKVLTIINPDEGWYSTTPIDKSMDSVPNDINVGGWSAMRTESNPDYGKGFQMWKMKLQIGDKYWNGSEWTSTDSTFYLSYNNNPDNETNEFIPAFEWINVVSNTTYKDQVGEDCYAIPIDSENESDPSFGTLKLTVYCPKIAPQELIDFYIQHWGSTSVYFGNAVVPVVYAKDFELGYVYTDTSVWWNNHSDTNDVDKVYIGWIDNNYVKDFDGIECKLNTSIKDKPISRSYVSTSDGYLSTLKHSVGDEEKTQEYNIVDLYLDHHSERKIVFNANMHGYFRPNQRFTKSQFSGNLFIDTQSYDFRNDNNTVKFIEF